MLRCKVIEWYDKSEIFSFIWFYKRNAHLCHFMCVNACNVWHVFSALCNANITFPCQRTVISTQKNRAWTLSILLMTGTSELDIFLASTRKMLNFKSSSAQKTKQNTKQTKKTPNKKPPQNPNPNKNSNKPKLPSFFPFSCSFH